MKYNVKSSITLPPSELALVLALMKKLGAKSKVEVVRKGLQLLKEKTDRNSLRTAFSEASKSTRENLKRELSDMDHLSGEGLD